MDIDQVVVEEINDRIRMGYKYFYFGKIGLIGASRKRNIDAVYIGREITIQKLDRILMWAN